MPGADDFIESGSDFAQWTSQTRVQHRTVVRESCRANRKRSQVLENRQIRFESFCPSGNECDIGFAIFERVLQSGDCFLKRIVTKLCPVIESRVEDLLLNRLVRDSVQCYECL